VGTLIEGSGKCDEMKSGN